MSVGIGCEASRDRLKAMVDGMASQSAALAAAAAELQQTMAERETVVAERTAPAGHYALNDVAVALEKVLLLWSCDAARPPDRGLDIWERTTLVGMAIEALHAMRP